MRLKLYTCFCSLLLILTACSSGSSNNNNSNNAEQDQANSLNTSNISRFYINQSIPAQDSDQTANEKAALVAGKDGLLRAFVKPSGSSAQEPVLRLHYRRADNSTGYIDIAPPAGGLSNQADESTLTENYNYTIDASLMQPGLQIYFELDPDKLMAEIDESNKRYPANGYLSLDIRTVPTLNVVVVPIQVNNNGIPSITLSSAREKLALAKKLFPLQQININLHAPINFNNKDDGNDEWANMLMELATVHDSEVGENSKTLYLGLIDDSPDGSNTAGIGYIAYPVSISMQSSQLTIAHELGHNFNLKHAPCGDPARPDANYPYSGGITGVSGYDIVNELLKLSSSNDLMGYCPQPIWISDYNYKIVYNFRQPSSSRSLHQVQAYQAPSEPESVLMVSGAIIDEQVEFKRVFQIQAKPGKLIHDSSYQLHIYGENNHLLHKQSFKARIIDHSQAMHFNIMVPTTAFNNETIQRLAIYQGDTLLTERRAKPKTTARTAARYQIATEQVASLLSWQGEQLRIQWDNQTYQNVMLRDAEQKTTLAIDSSGKILLEASSLKNQKQLILIYSDGLNSHSETLSIPPR